MKLAEPVRPPLRAVPLAEVLPPRLGMAYVTMSVGQWDGLLAETYRTGWVLLELDDYERPVRAFRKAGG